MSRDTGSGERTRPDRWRSDFEKMRKVSIWNRRTRVRFAAPRGRLLCRRRRGSLQRSPDAGADSMTSCEEFDRLVGLDEAVAEEVSFNVVASKCERQADAA
jgi:hypothetical protein